MMLVVILLMKVAYQAKALSVNKVGLGITKQEHCLVSMYEQVDDGDDDDEVVEDNDSLPSKSTQHICD